LQAGFRTAAELKTQLLAGLDVAREAYGEPIERVGHDSSRPIWVWLTPFVRTRPDWAPAVGNVLRHIAIDGDPLAHKAIVNVLNAQLHSIALLPWTEDLADVLGDVTSLQAGARWPFDGPRTARRILTAQREMLDQLLAPDHLALLEGEFGPKASKVTLESAKDVQAAVAQCAKRGKFAFSPWGERLLSWVYPESLRLPWLNDGLEPVIRQLLAGDINEVVTAIDWLFEQRELYRWAGDLESLAQSPPSWWTVAAGAKVSGWRKRWPLSPFHAKRTLGDAVRFLLPFAHRQAELPAVMDLPELGVA